MDHDNSPAITADRWEPQRRAAARWPAYALGGVAAVVAVVLAVWTWRSGRPAVPEGPPKPPPTANEFREGAQRCWKARDLACAEVNWAEVVRQRPTDGRAVANLAMVLNLRDKHEQAVIQFQKAVGMGEGTYDMFAYYADSLEKLGKVDEAIDWSYRALSVYPALVDVRGSLAKLLVQRQRPHEALALLQAYDADSQANGHPPYFGGQRISIENLIRDGDTGTATAAAKPLRLPTFAGHFFAPVALGSARPVLFVVDTGASSVTMSRAMLQASKAAYRVVDANGFMIIANGSRVPTQRIVLASLRVGPFELKDVPASVCDGCAPLLGQTALSQFDLQSSRAQGVEFLTMSPRAGAAAGTKSP
jgi:tetratricopeptide (TPR) repeat protein